MFPRPTIEERQDKPRGRRAGLLIGASVGAAALLGGGAWLVSAVLPDEQTPTQQTADDVAAGDADDDADAANAAEDTESSDEEQAASDVPPGEDFVTIDGITVDDGVYVVDFTTYEYEAELPGQHVHFFFDTVPTDQAGVPGDGPWILYGGSSPFTEYTEADRPDGAGQMCALVANPDHSVVAESGTCVDLP